MKLSHILILALVIAFMCSGCSFLNQPDSYEYTEIYQRLTEPYGASFIQQGNVLQTIVGTHTYEFEDVISEKARTLFITAQEKLCKLLKEQGLLTDGLTFRVLEDYPNRTESDNHLAYYGLRSMNTWEQVLTTVQVCLGDYTNYGYLYALSNHVAKELQWTCDNITVASIEVFANDPSLLNLVYPCFSEKYSDIQVINTCKDLAVKLLSNTGNIWSETEFLEARTIYAKDNNIDFAPTYVTFAYNSASCPLKLTCQYLELFWDSTFVANNEYLDGDIPVDYTDGVSGLIHTFQWLDAQLSDLCDRLNVNPGEQIPVQMMERLPEGYASPYFETGGLYNRQENTVNIYATTVTCLAHEYMHHIYYLLYQCSDPDYEQWQNEVMAYYYTVGRDYEYRLNIINNVDSSYRQRLETTLNEAYDNPDDTIKLLRIVCRNEELPYIYHLKTDNSLCSAFGEYFVRTYGEEAFQNSMLFPSHVKEFTGKSMDQIVDEWCIDMENPEND